MVISLPKSWLWATQCKWWEDLRNVNLLFPSCTEEIPVLQHAKDLGEIVQYNKACFSKPAIDRVDEAINRLDRLKTFPLSIQEKAKRIQTGIWPFGLYAADTHFIGMKHFSRLRRAASNALLGAHQHVNPFIACLSLSRYLEDPMLYTILVAMRSIRRLFAIDSARAKKIIEAVASFQATVAYGPASSLCKYLRKIHAWVDDEANVCTGDGKICNLAVNSCKEIKLAMTHFWVRVVFADFVQRKGAPIYPMDVNLQWSVYSKLSDVEQKLIALNITGGFQTNAVKSKWDESIEVKCDFCDQVDCRIHRLAYCPATKHIRDQHADAVEIFESIKTDWQYLPLVSHHPSVLTMDQFFRGVQLMSPEPVTDSGQQHHVYFTDGGCINPTIAEARISSWAVVRDFATSEAQSRALTCFASDLGRPCPMLRCVDMGIVPGRQSISRGELCAMIIACESASGDAVLTTADFYTDSQYVLNVIHFFTHSDLMRWGYKIANFDLVQRLYEVWKPRQFRAHKIKSHVDWIGVECLAQRRLYMGNFVVDKLASLALKRCPKFLHDLVASILEDKATEKQSLSKVCQYLVELNKERRRLETEKHVPAASSLQSQNVRNLMCADAVPVLQAYHFPGGVYVCHDDLNADVLRGSLQGRNLARYILKWAATLEWPDENTDWSASETDAVVSTWGISWFELFINFYIMTGKLCPVRVSGSLDKVVEADYNSDQAKLLPGEKRSAMVQTTCFQAACRCVESLLQKKLFPSGIQKGGRAIHRYGFTGQVAGVATRPKIHRQVETVQTVYQYISTIVNKKKLRNSLDGIVTFQDIHIDSLPELDAGQRYRIYKNEYKKRSQ
eukprot:s137_g16.t1